MEKVVFSEFIKEVATRANMPQAKVKVVITSMIEEIEASLMNGKEVSIPKLGKFYTKELPAREVRNPKTGELFEVDESRVPKFKLSSVIKKALKDG